MVEHIMYHIFKIIFSILKENDDSPTKIYTKRIENKNILNIMTGYNFELLTPETIKLPGSN